jgi:molybdopterin biosynthesis enzyme MoaB
MIPAFQRHEVDRAHELIVLGSGGTGPLERDVLVRLSERFHEKP